MLNIYEVTSLTKILSCVTWYSLCWNTNGQTLLKLNLFVQAESHWTAMQEMMNELSDRGIKKFIIVSYSTVTQLR